MKTIKCAFYILFTTFISISSSFGQTYITLDFNTKQYMVTGGRTSLEDFKPGDYFQLKITNFNPYLYKVTLNKTDTSNNKLNTTPALLNIFSIANLTSLVSSLTAMAPATTPGAPAVPPGMGRPGIAPPPANPCLAIAKVIEKERANITSLYGRIDGLSAKTNAYKFDLQKMWLKTQLLDITNNSCTQDFVCSTFLATTKGFIDEKDKIISDASDEYKNYQTKANGCLTKITADADLKAKDDLIRKVYSTGIADFSTKFDSTIGYAALPQILSQLINLPSSNTFEYLSLPQQVADDAVSFNINIQPQTSTIPLQSYSTTLIFPFKHKTFWSFSGGFYLTGLHSEVYSNKLVSGNYSLIRENSGGIETGVNALIHYGHYFKTEKGNLFWHLSMGPGLALLKNPVPRLMLGGGIGAGRKNKVFFTGGAIFGQVDRLGAAYPLSQTYSQAQSGYTISAIRCNAFFSISYSFLGSN